MAVIHVTHIALGLPSPLENCPHLHQLLQAICHWQPQPHLDLGQHGITMEFLCQARPLHWLHNTKDSMLWAILTISNYGLFNSRELAQPKLAEARVALFIRVVGHCPSLHARSLTLHVHQPVRQQDWPLPAGLPYHHRLYRDSSV